ncbi:NAD(P)-dependent oxidoreductase [Rhodoligotrophos defluvii]|uniref:NAD(P)-dependent oxidoreductase n=1 Tax=Rhodoligotrophos defluvii TaxID=2561934 RepID=UPI0010C991AB|nr:NAD(P)-dependent oxidoreductase [Rhodoligotrophos defluvii]
MRIGFAGVGLMGQGMAENLLRHGHELNVLGHHNRKPVEALAALGAVEWKDAAALAAESEAIILCLPNSAVVEAVIESMGREMRAGQLIIDTTTANPESTRRLHAQLKEKHIALVDAPLAGGPKESKAGQLGALVGATEHDFARAEPLLACFCREISWFGPPGSGNTAKLISNYQVLGTVAVIVETFRLAREAGIDWKKLYDVMLCGSGNSLALRRIMDQAVTGDFDGYPFSVANARKDITYALDLIRSMQCTTPLAEAINDVYVRAAASGDPQRFISQLLAEEFHQHD